MAYAKDFTKTELYNKYAILIDNMYSLKIGETYSAAIDPPEFAKKLRKQIYSFLNARGEKKDFEIRLRGDVLEILRRDVREVTIKEVR